jgi:mannose-6-phosphate isomerase-like protein (cupin superfamily)
MFQVISATADQVDGGPNRTIPRIFGDGSGMRRFVTDRDLDFRAGYTKVLPSQGIRTFFWYDEFWVTLEGVGQVTATDRPSGQVIEQTLNPHDLVFIPAGTHIDMKVPGNSNVPFLFFYIAIPASNKHAHWLAAMTPEDVEDVRIRNEHTPEAFAAEMKKGKPLLR